LGDLEADFVGVEVGRAVEVGLLEELGFGFAETREVAEADA